MAINQRVEASPVILSEYNNRKRLESTTSLKLQVRIYICFDEAHLLLGIFLRHFPPPLPIAALLNTDPGSDFLAPLSLFSSLK